MDITHSTAQKWSGDHEKSEKSDILQENTKAKNRKIDDYTRVKNRL